MMFDDVVDSGNDQELFIAGYLNGHFSLIASQCINAKAFTLAALDEKLQQSLDTAFDNNELEIEDQTQVRAFWSECLSSL
ncbi:YfcL family protein [Alteromonas sp. a30]|nr:YfcL family protein [Alteromonas sp. a30]